MGVPQPPSVNPTKNFHMMLMEKQMVLASGMQPQDMQASDFKMKDWKKNATPEEIQEFKNQKKIWKQGKTPE